MDNTQFIQTAEIKEKYDGKYANLEPWKRKFKSRLAQRNPERTKKKMLEIKYWNNRHKTYTN